MFRRLVSWWLTLKSFERSGRFYEFIGVAAVDRWLARVFGDQLIRPYSPDLTESSVRMREAFYKSQYVEVVNMMATLIHLTLLGLILWQGHMGLAVYCFLVMMVHVLPIPIERYKRACIGSWMAHPEALTSGDYTIAHRRSLGQLQHPYFQPKPWETEERYEKIGVWTFKRFAFWLSSLSNKLPGDQESTTNTLGSRDLGRIDSFERGTRVGEAIHLVGIAQHIPFWWWFAVTQYWVGLIYLLWPLYLNLYAALLQRQHRARIFRLLVRAAQKREAAPTS